MRKAQNAQRKTRRHMLVALTSDQTTVRQTGATHLTIHRNTTAQWLSRGARAMLLVVVAATSTACHLSAAIYPT